MEVQEVEVAGVPDRSSRQDSQEPDSGFYQVSPSTSGQTQRPVSQDSTALSVGGLSVGGGGLMQNTENETKFQNQQLCSSTPGGRSARSASSALEKSECSLTYHGLTYRIETVKGCFKKTKSHKCIVNNVSGKFHPGMNAILGPTGSGKSTMLDCLAGRKDPSRLYGRVLVNGSPQPHNFKCMVGYVVQDDVLMGMLTVRENIAFSAALRLSSSVSNKDKTQRVTELIEELGLTKCADTKVGTALKRGISGGEMKRTSIAMEMITQPNVLFLDEPTTGLDAYTAHSVMHLLQKLGARGKIVIFSIHQPRYSIYKLFDSVTLLSGGECVYHGQTDSALSYFQEIGYTCEDHNNPSDFFLDIVSGAILPSSSEDDESPKRNGNGVHYNSDDEELMMDIELSHDNDDYVTNHQKVLVDNFRNSAANHGLLDDLKMIAGNSTVAETKKSKKRQRIKYPNSYPTQLLLVCRRTFKNMIRNPHTLATQALSATLLGVLVGSIYLQVDDSYTSGIQNRVGAFFFIVMNFVFGNMAAVDLFIKERVLFLHESVSGFYRVSVYFIGKLLCDVLPMRAVPIFIFSVITYWMIGLQNNVWCFLFFALNILLTSLAGTSVALFMSASVNNHSVATILTALIWVLMMIFSGLLVNINTINPALRWMKWTSIFRYSMNALTINELKDTRMCDHTSSSIGNSTTVCDTGNAYMQRQGIPYDSHLDLWINEIALVIIALLFMTLAYIQLRRASRPR